MYKEFEVRWEDVLPAEPQQVWDAITKHASAWIWEMSFEPRVGGAERGLTSDGGTVTIWDPPHRFQTRAERPGGWFNQLGYTLEPHADGTLVRYAHNSVTEDYEIEYDACVRHTDFYRQSMVEYLRYFSGREAAHVTVEAPGSFDAVPAALGVTAVGDRVTLPGGEGTVDYLAPAFLGVRTNDAHVRVFGRDAWGGDVAVSLHLFSGDADPAEAERTWTAWLNKTLDTTKAVA